MQAPTRRNSANFLVLRSSATAQVTVFGQWLKHRLLIWHMANWTSFMILKCPAIDSHPKFQQILKILELYNYLPHKGGGSGNWFSSNENLGFLLSFDFVMGIGLLKNTSCADYFAAKAKLPSTNKTLSWRVVWFLFCFLVATGIAFTFQEAKLSNCCRVFILSKQPALKIHANMSLPQCLWIPDIQLGAADNEKELTAMSQLSQHRVNFSVS